MFKYRRKVETAIDVYHRLYRMTKIKNSLILTGSVALAIYNKINRSIYDIDIITRSILVFDTLRSKAVSSKPCIAYQGTSYLLNFWGTYWIVNLIHMKNYINFSYIIYNGKGIFIHKLDDIIFAKKKIIESSERKILKHQNDLNYIYQGDKKPRLSLIR